MVIEFNDKDNYAQFYNFCEQQDIVIQLSIMIR